MNRLSNGKTNQPNAERARFAGHSFTHTIESRQGPTNSILIHENKGLSHMKPSKTVIYAALCLGALALNAPAGFEFNPQVAVTARVNSQGKKTINGVPDGGTIPATVTPNTITITITSVSRGGLAFPDTLTFQNIQVRPTAGNTLASGDITESGTCRFRHLTLSSGTWGHLQEVGAAIPNVILADPLGDWDGD